MTTQALVLADRDGSELEPVADHLLPALIPVAGKPVIQHCIEDLWEAGVREVLVAVPAGDRTIERELGSGQRFGMSLRYVNASEGAGPGEVFAVAAQTVEPPLLVARGDVLRGRAARALLESARSIESDIVHGTIGSRRAGIALLRSRCNAINQLGWSQLRSAVRSEQTRCVELGDIGFAALDSLPGLYDTCLAALEHRFAGLLTDGRAAHGSGLRVAARASVARSVHVTGIARVGRGADLHDDVELAGRVEVGDRCVVDTGAQLIDAVVLPGTYVGRGVRLQNAFAHGAWLYRADLDTCQRVEDPLLLAGPTAAAA